MEGNHCFYGPPPPSSCPFRPLVPLYTPHASCPSCCNLPLSIESEAIRKTITISIRLYSSAGVCQSLFHSLTCPVWRRPPPPLHHLSVDLEAGTHAGLINVTDSRSEKHQRWRKYGAREAGWPPIRGANKEQIELLMMGSRVPIDEPVKSQPYDHSHTHDNTLPNNVS